MKMGCDFFAVVSMKIPHRQRWNAVENYFKFLYFSNPELPDCSKQPNKSAARMMKTSKIYLIFVHARESIWPLTRLEKLILG